VPNRPSRLRLPKCSLSLLPPLCACCLRTENVTYFLPAKLPERTVHVHAGNFGEEGADASSPGVMPQSAPEPCPCHRPGLTLWAFPPHWKRGPLPAAVPHVDRTWRPVPDACPSSGRGARTDPVPVRAGGTPGLSPGRLLSRHPESDPEPQSAQTDAGSGDHVGHACALSPGFCRFPCSLSFRVLCSCPW